MAEKNDIAAVAYDEHGNLVGMDPRPDAADSFVPMWKKYGLRIVTMPRAQAFDIWWADWPRRKREWMRGVGRRGDVPYGEVVVHDAGSSERRRVVVEVDGQEVAELSVSGAARQIGFADRDEITLTFRAGATWTTS